MKLPGLRLKDLWWFSLPSIISSVFEPLASVVDTALVGRLSAESLGSLALCAGIFNAITWVFNFLVHTSTQSIADSTAQKDPNLLKQRVQISMTMALLVGVLCSCVLYFPSHSWFSVMGGDEKLWPDFIEYFRPRALFHTLTILSVTLLSILRGYSDLKVVVYIMTAGTMTNIFLSWLFLYPLNYGLAGAAYGTIVSNLLVVLVCLFFLLKKKNLKLNLLNIFTFNLPHEQLFKFGRNSLNVFGRSFVLTGCFFLATRLASFIGVKSLAAHQVLLQVWLLGSFFLDGLAISGNILGARFFFAGKVRTTRIIFNKLLKLGVVVGAIFTLSYGLFWEQVLQLFTKDPEVLKIMLQLKWPIVLSQLVSAIAFVYDGLIFGLDGFSYLRKHMFIGAIFFYLPFTLYTLVSPELMWIWAGLISLNVYRTISGYQFVVKKVG